MKVKFFRYVAYLDDVKVYEGVTIDPQKTLERFLSDGLVVIFSSYKVGLI